MRKWPTNIPLLHLDFFTVAKLSNALLGSVIVSCVGLAAAICAFFLIEMKSVGRWPLVFWGVVGITLSMRKCSLNISSLLFSLLLAIPFVTNY
jgi:hypothetical protein